MSENYITSIVDQDNNVEYEIRDAEARDDITDLKSAVNHTVIVNATMEQGSLSGSTGKETSSNEYVRTSDFISISDFEKFYKPSAITAAVFPYTDKADSAFLNAAITYNAALDQTITKENILSSQPTTKYFKIRAKVRNETATTPEQFTATGAYITVYTPVTQTAENAKTEIYGNINSLKNGMSPYILPIASNSDMVENGYINSTTGVIASSSTWKATDYMPVFKAKKIYCIMPTFASANTGGMAFYDSDKQYISGIAGSASGTAGYEETVITVPNNAAYARFSIRAEHVAEFYANTGSLIETENKVNTLSIDTYAMQLFEKIGVVGDSISVGWAKDKNGHNSRRNTGISWVQQMARRLGCTAYNLGASGVDPIEWFQSDFEFAQYCYQYYQSTEACDLYIIGLGWNGGTMGTVDDINESDYTQNAETFYGQYARIIQTINHDHPNSIVMCITEPTTGIQGYDAAVRNICALSFINAELVDLENDYFDLFNTPEIIAEHQPDNLHFTPYGYSLLADAMVKALSDYISKNSDAFKYVGVATV